MQPYECDSTTGICAGGFGGAGGYGPRLPFTRGDAWAVSGVPLFTPYVGGGITGDYANTYLRGRKRTSTDILLDRRSYGLDEKFNSIMTRWGRPKKKE